MSKQEDRALDRLNNHLLSAECQQAVECRVKNTDRTDVDMEAYTRAVEEPVKTKHRGWAVLLMLVLAAAAGYLLWRYI